MKHLLDQLGVGDTGEQGAQGYQLVERRTQAIHVASSIGPGVKSLGSHVADRADDVAGAGWPVGAFNLRQAKVGDPDVTGGVEEQVGGLDVAVQNALPMGVGSASATCKPIRATERCNSDPVVDDKIEYRPNSKPGLPTSAQAGRPFRL